MNCKTPCGTAITSWLFAPAGGQRRALGAFKSFSSENPYNPAGYQNQDYNNLLSQIKASPGEDGAALCLQAENHLIQNLVFYPLVYEKRYFASAQNVTGIIFHPITVESTSLGLRKPRQKHDPRRRDPIGLYLHILLRRQMPLLRFLFSACRQPDDGRLLRPFDFRAFSLE